MKKELQKTIRNFAKLGFERGTIPFQKGTHLHVLKNKDDNFFGKPIFKFHRWAGSLTSSQAFAYNIFSGVAKPEEFEFGMWALRNSPIRKACIDVAIEDKNGIIDMYEVKMFELASIGKNRIFHKEHEKYLDPNNYECSTPKVAKHFVKFITDVKRHFEDKRIYGEGIKQLCCHLLGITNEMKNNNGNLRDKKVNLYSFCYDHDISSEEFSATLENYRTVLKDFSPMVENYLKNVSLHNRVKYCGFLSAKGYIEKNRKFIGDNNYKYIKNRYFF